MPDSSYIEILRQAVAEIITACSNIARQVNTVAVGRYWNMGKLLSERKIGKQHGAGVVNRLSIVLKAEFPDMGLSPRDLCDMRRFYERYNLAWGHNVLLINKISEDEEALWYAQKARRTLLVRNILLNYLNADRSENR